MKYFLFYVFGFISGIIVTFLCLFFLYELDRSDPSTSELDGLTYLTNEGSCISSFRKGKVFQVVKPHIALVQIGDPLNSLTVLLISSEDTSHYEDQIITLPSNTCFWHKGSYQYETMSGMTKTIAAVEIR